MATKEHLERKKFEKEYMAHMVRMCNGIISPKTQMKMEWIRGVPFLLTFNHLTNEWVRSKELFFEFVGFRLGLKARED